jgi:hypothetical protein
MKSGTQDADKTRLRREIELKCEVQIVVMQILIIERKGWRKSESWRNRPETDENKTLFFECFQNRERRERCCR